MKIKTVILTTLIILLLPVLLDRFFLILHFNTVSKKLTDAILDNNKAEIFSSIESLKQIARKNSRDALVYRRLAQAYLAVGNEEEAIKSLLIARNLSPKSIIVQRELGLTYILVGQSRVGLRILSNISNSPESLSSLIESILEEQIDEKNYQLVYSLLEASGITFADAEQIANKAVSLEDWRKAFYWLLAAQMLDPELKKTLSFRKVVAIYMSGIDRKNISEEDMSEIPTHRLPSGNKVDIKGGDFRWARDAKEWGVSFGTPAAISSESD
ncbi:MAG: tetratricopeptide repeat protein, partial [Chloroflexus sp.]|uniref:tetratricopeptide repeat protein n=2 Tax=Chloroflexus sp. TaxID=1904827 RepID=UPI00404ACAB6